MNNLSPSPLLVAFLTFVLIVATACAPAAAPPTTAITNIVWQWTSVTNRDSGGTTAVHAPQDYTIICRADCMLSGQADCNLCAGTYAQEGGFFVTATPKVMAACGGDSLDQQPKPTASNAVMVSVARNAVISQVGNMQIHKPQEIFP